MKTFKDELKTSDSKKKYGCGHNLNTETKKGVN